jgi:hypothetical protein
MSIPADQEVVTNHDIPFLEAAYFVDQCGWIDNNTVADDAEGVLMEDTGRNKVQYVLFILDDDRMAGIVSALVSGNNVSLSREIVDDLTLPFVSPLCSDDHDN